MRFDRDRAIFLGLAVLHRVAEDCRHTPADGGVALRAMLSAMRVIAGGEREPFDAFWNAATGADDTQAGPMMAIERSNRTMAAWHGVSRALGAPGDIAYYTAICAASRGDVTALPWHAGEVCNRYRMTASRAEAMSRYGVTVEPLGDWDAPPIPDLFPKRMAWVVRVADGQRILERMTWGVPTTVKGAKGQPIEKPVTNVRNLTSPFWRSMLNNAGQRCLVPVTSFSEYGQTRGADGKMPIHWFEVPSRPVFSFAGIWRPSSAGITFAFLTCPPNSIVAPIHPKAMPVILHDDDEERWLAGEDAAVFAEPYPAQLMRSGDISDS